MEHKHAAVLRAIADGVPLSEFEVSRNQVFWAALGEYQISSLDAYDLYIRRKPQHIIVNGFKVPKPLDVLPENNVVFVPSPCQRGHYISLRGSGADYAIESRIAHETIEAAKAHCKAMLGIDPKWEE